MPAPIHGGSLSKIEHSPKPSTPSTAGNKGRDNQTDPLRGGVDLPGRSAQHSAPTVEPHNGARA